MTGRFMKIILATAIILGLQSQVLAASTSSGTETASKGVESSSSPSPKPTLPSTPSITESAKQSTSQNRSAQATQLLMSGMMFSKSYAHFKVCKTGVKWECAMGAMTAGLGALSLKQSKNHATAADQSSSTQVNTDGGGNGDNSNGDKIAELEDDKNVKGISSNISKLEAAGILDMKKGTIKTPDGKSYKLSDFGSKKAMAAAGFSPGAIAGASDLYAATAKAAQDKVEKLKIGALTESAGFEEGGGSGQGIAVAAINPEDYSASASSGLGGGLGLNSGLNRDPSSFAGMQKQYNGEPIGVSADSIFMMMTRRYKLKESQETFFTEAELALQK